MPVRRPIVEELSPVPAITNALAAFADRPGVLLFDSALRDADRGRYSFLTAEPVETFRLERPAFGCDPFVDLRRTFSEFDSQAVDGLPPFQGGIAGLAGYELGGCWERLPAPPVDDFSLPVLWAGLYEWVIAWDHVQDCSWLVVQPWAHNSGQRAAEIRQLLSQPPHRDPNNSPAAPAARLTIGTPQHQLNPETQRGSELFSNFSRDQYLAAVARAIEYIRAGDIFQANLSHRLLCRATCPPLDLYRRLRTANPAPFAGYLAVDDWTLLSASPERLIRVDGDVVETRPIKGTRRRRSTPEADLFTRDELRESDKDQAENVMIVDLLRNDLSRVCRPGTIQVPQLCGVETYQTVQHLVSRVRGQLNPGLNLLDVLAAVFPGGSITGAPKVRAMEIITEIEGVARGPYCGSLFYLSAGGRADSSILIRTLVQRGDCISCGVGGGIVAQSDPASEYAETLDKAAGMLRALPVDL